MLKNMLFTLALILCLPVFAQSTCPALDTEINELRSDINALIIPELSYTVNEENCALVDPILETVYEIESKLMKLLGLYENYYFECSRDIDLIYLMEDTKINILLMQTLTALAKNLHLQCQSLNGEIP